MTPKPDTRQQILDSAAALFHSQSVAEVGIATICHQAGVSKGSFFHFFPSKRDLVLAVMHQFQQQLDTTVLAKAFSPDYAPMERLQRLVQALYNYQKTLSKEYGRLPGCPFGNLAMEQATLDEVLRIKAEHCLDALALPIRAAISEAVRSGALPEVDEIATADAMLSYIEGIQLLAKARNDPSVIRELGPAVSCIQVAKKT